MQRAKDRFAVPYPAQLKEAIIQRNLALLSDAMPAYRTQMQKAIQRWDLVSINHRTAAFMESYFDIIWALNEQTHPGEKRLLSLCKQRCPLLPAHFEENIQQLYADLFTNSESVNEDIDKILDELKKVL